MSEPLLRVTGLQAWYGDSRALHGVDLEVRKGETVTLVGRNGAGKTTTLRAILGMLRKRSGQVAFDGIDLLALPLHRVARLGVGYVPEERGIFASLTVLENLTLAPIVAPGGFSLDDIFALFPNLSERRATPGTKLSGGEQQMLAMARVLRTGARFLMLDEPTEGLAPVIVQRIGDVLHMLKDKGFTVLLVEQNFRFASALADRFYVMDNGYVLDHFGIDELASRVHKLDELLGL